jgi:putative oxidoreductase
MAQREISLLQLTTTTASGWVVLIRAYVGLIFIAEGILKYLRPDALGPGRFDMIGALLFTKVPLLWGSAPLYPKEGGAWDFIHKSRLEVAMLCGSVFLFIVGAGAHSADARTSRVNTPAAVS